MGRLPRLLGVSEAVTRSSSPAHGEWGQVEDPAAVASILQELHGLPHFDVYRRAEEYELAYPGYPGDTVYYTEQARDGRVLYLGVGTGRIFRKMLERNPDVVGLDSSPEMLSLLRRRLPGLRPDQVLLGDAACVALPTDQFDTIVAPYSFLQALGEEALPLVLRNVRHWLKPGGRFHTDVFSPYIIPFRRPGLEASARRIRDTRIAIYIRHDHLRQSMEEMALIESPRGRHLLIMPLRYYFPKQLADAFRAAGLPEPTIAGGYHGEPFDPCTSEILVLETSKPGPPLPAGPA